MSTITEELIQLATTRVKQADAKGKHKDQPEKPPNLRPSQGASQSCATCKHFQRTLMDNTCTKYKYPVEPTLVCDSYEPQEFTPPEPLPPALGDLSPFVGSVAATPGVAPTPKMAEDTSMGTQKQADMLQLQAPGQFAAGSITPPGGGPQSNAASGIAPPPAQPLTPPGPQQQPQQQPQQPQQTAQPQQTTAGTPMGGFKPSPTLGLYGGAPQLSGMAPFVPPDPNVQQTLQQKQACFGTMIRLAKSRLRVGK